MIFRYILIAQVLRYWPFGAVWCRIWLAVDVWLCTASIFNLCAISLDRYVAISRPVKYPAVMSRARKINLDPRPGGMPAAVEVVSCHVPAPCPPTRLLPHVQLHPNSSSRGRIRDSVLPTLAAAAAADDQ